MNIQRRIYRTEEWQIYVLLIIFSMLILLLPILQGGLESGGAVLGKQSFYHMRVAQYILDGEWPSVDPMVYFTRPLYMNIFHFVLAFFMFFLRADIAAKVLPLLLGVLSILLFHAILKKYDLDKVQRVIVLALVVLSPIFIYSFSTLNVHSFAVVLTLAALLFYMHDGKIFLFLCIASVLLVSSLSLINGFIILLSLLVYSVQNKHKQRWFMLIFFILLFFYLFFQPDLLLKYDAFKKTNIFVDFISDFGALAGFSIFLIILSFIGHFITWKEKRKHYTLYLFVITMIVLSVIFDYRLSIYLIFILALAAMTGFLALYNLKWRLKLLRDLTLLIIVCGLLFSTLSFMDRIEDSSVRDGKLATLTWLSLNSEEGDGVLSHYSEGFEIQMIARRKVVVDSLSALSLGFEKTMEEVDEIFYSRNLKNTEALLNKYNIRYILVTEAMREGLVWNDDDEGLLFLLKKGETFKNPYSSDDIEIWHYVKDRGAVEVE